MVELSTVNRVVVGSNPTPRATDTNRPSRGDFVIVALRGASKLLCFRPSPGLARQIFLKRLDLARHWRFYETGKIANQFAIFGFERRESYREHLERQTSWGREHLAEFE